MKLRAIELERAQLGWSGEVYFTAFGPDQFTAQEYVRRIGGTYLLTALWNAVRTYKREANRIERYSVVARQLAGW